MIRGLLAIVLVSTGCGHAPLEEDVPPADPIQAVPAEDLVQQGLSFARSGDLVRAEQYVAAAMTRGYPQERALPMLIRICVASSRYRAALGYAEPYLTDHPDAWALRYLVASIYYGMGDPVTARRELETVIRGAPEIAEPYYLLGILLRDEVGDPESAERHFRRYLELAPDGERAAEVSHALATVRLTVDAPEAEPPAAEEEAEEEEEATQ